MSKINAYHSHKQYTSFTDFLLENIKEKQPFEGILTIKILTNGNKTILLLGETHQIPDYKSGCTLIINFLNQLFRNNSILDDKFYIDFFLELTRNPIFVYNKYNEIASQKYNTKPPTPLTHDYTSIKRGSLTNIKLNNTTQLVQIRSWTEPCIMNREKFANPETRLEGEVERFFLNKRVCYKDVRYHWIDTTPFLHKSLAGIIIHIFTLKSILGLNPTIISNDDFAMLDYFYENPQDKIETEDDLIKIISHDKLIQKEAKKSNIKMEFLQKHFLIHKENINKMHSNFKWNNLLLFYSRFVVDAYSFCRLMKNENPWYKNIILYGGKGHTDNLLFMLIDWDPLKDRITSIDGNEQDNEKFRLLDIDFKINSKCIKNLKYKKELESIEEKEKEKEKDKDKLDISYPVLEARLLTEEELKKFDKDKDKVDISYPVLEAQLLTEEELKKLDKDKIGGKIIKKKTHKKKNYKKHTRKKRNYKKKHTRKKVFKI
jgi:hypothetical protein